MQLDNGVQIEIKRSWYNKSKVSEDGITHTIDTDTTYPLYQLQIDKNYFDLTDDNEAVRAVVDDLKNTIQILENTLEKEENEKGAELEEKEKEL
jgi:hypothetical protein